MTFHFAIADIILKPNKTNYPGQRTSWTLKPIITTNYGAFKISSLWFTPFAKASLTASSFPTSFFLTPWTNKKIWKNKLKKIRKKKDFCITEETVLALHLTIWRKKGTVNQKWEFHPEIVVVNQYLPVLNSILSKYVENMRNCF